MSRTTDPYRGWHSALASTLAISMVLLGPTATLARAGTLTTQAILEQALPDEVSHQARERLHRTLARPEVTLQLTNLGIAASEARLRISALSDAEVASLNGRIDQIPAGGGAVGVIVGAILIVFLVLLFTDLIGATDVFPWVNKR